jgi:cation diffusion facilitator family transporter
MADPILQRYAWLSIAAALATITLKFVAWWITDSVGLLSDAIESLVNLVAAGVALWMLVLAARPPDDEHAFGYSKAEYFSSGFEGVLIFVAALAIGIAAVRRLLEPQPLEQVGPGLVVSAVAAAINLGVARALFSAGRTHRSIALEADAEHLMTDVWTSIGVILGVLAVTWTGWLRLDPIIALAVAANIVLSGFRLVQRSATGLMDRAVPERDRAAIAAVLARYESQGIEFHAVRTRQAAGRAFVSMHVLVPGEWSVAHAHDMVESIEAELRVALHRASVMTHLEPKGVAASYEDIPLDRA